MDGDSLNEVVEDLEELLGDDYETVWVAKPVEDSMLDLINPCVKCGSGSTIYDEGADEYECLDCGFKWEVLKNE